MTAAINNNGGSQFDIIIGGVVTGTFDGTGFTGVKDASITAAKLAGAVKPVGTGQTRQNVGASRTYGVNYTNNTGRTIRVRVEATIASGTNSLLYYIAGQAYYSGSSTATNRVTAEFDVFDGETYQVSAGGITTILSWWEVR